MFVGVCGLAANGRHLRRHTALWEEQALMDFTRKNTRNWRDGRAFALRTQQQQKAAFVLHENAWRSQTHSSLDK